MEAGAVLLLLFALCTTSASNFYGNSISFAAPKRNRDGTFTVILYHRQNDRNGCQSQSSFTCDEGVCTNLTESNMVQTDQDDVGQGRWCQSETYTTAIIQTTKTSFTLRSSGCCWLPNVEGKTNWTSHAEVNLGTRSDIQTYNHCPVAAILSFLRVPQNCFTRIHLLAHDPDGDHVKCSFAANTTAPVNISLDEATCILTKTGQVGIGVHVFEVMLEDFPTKNITLTHADGTREQREALNMTRPPLCRVKLQFSVEVLPPILICQAGHTLPMFLFMTPSQGDVLHATVGENFQLSAEAQAHHANIQTFQVSGPPNMNKTFTDEQNGVAKLTLSWKPHERDLNRFVPVCFTAETNNAQSDMRCVVVMVIQSFQVQGKATVQCSPNKMVVVLEKASMPGIDTNYLKLRDQKCSLTSNGTHIIGTMSFSTCGTKIEEMGEFIVFTNQITSFVMPNEIIIRRRSVKINFYCKFPRMLSISNYFNLHDSEYIFTESNFGSFGYSFEIFLDSNFTNKVQANAYPVQVTLLQMVYMGIQAQSELPNVKLFVESCRGTPDDNANNPIFYDLIKNGCVLDETIKIHHTNQTVFNFEVQSFKFSNFDQVYITCSVILCDSNSLFSRCAQGCLTSPSRRRRRDLILETESHSISQGPLQFVERGVPLAAMEDNDIEAMVKQSNTPIEGIPSSAPPKTDTTSERHLSKSSGKFKQWLSTNVSTIVFASLFLTSLVLVVVVVLYFNRRKSEEHKFLLDSDHNS